MSRSTLALCLLLIVSNVACGADAPQAESPEELLAKIKRVLTDNDSPRWNSRATVKCVVATVDYHRTETSAGIFRNDLRLRPTGDPSLRFVVTLSEKVEADLNRLGIDNMSAHFVGKTVVVTGPITITEKCFVGVSDPTYQIRIDQLDQFIEVRSGKKNSTK